MRTIKRALVLAIVLAFTLGLAAIASGAKPECNPDSNNGFCKDNGGTTPTTEAPQPECVFNQEGVLQGWDGSARFNYRCQWIVEDPDPDTDTSFVFRIIGDDGAASIRSPYLAVLDDRPGDICERQMPIGQYDLPYQFETFTLPSSGECTYEGNQPNVDTDGRNSFALTIGIQKVTPKGGTLSLTITPPPPP